MKWLWEQSKQFHESLPDGVENISWNDIMEFCMRLSIQTGMNITLPTGTQSEYACQAEMMNRYWGTKTNGYYCRFSANAGGEFHSVGAKKPNIRDVHGMSGVRAGIIRIITGIHREKTSWF